MRSNTGETILALLTGAIVGAGLGILYAPAKGSETRKKLGDEASKAGDRIRETVEETTSNLSKKAQKTRSNFEKKLAETLETTSHKADDILLALEDKLEKLREENAKLGDKISSKK